MMMGDKEIVVRDTVVRDIYFRKLQDSSITIHQAFRLLLKPHVKGSGNALVLVRTGLKIVRNDLESKQKWTRVLETRHPHLTHYCAELWRQNAKELETVRLYKQEQINFWDVLFDHMIRVCFIHPQMFLTNVTPLGQAIQIIRNAWVDFVAVYTVTDLESQLTAESLTTRDNESLLTVNQALEPITITTERLNPGTRHFSPEVNHPNPTSNLPAPSEAL